jgi:hypothetical protein
MGVTLKRGWNREAPMLYRQRRIKLAIAMLFLVYAIIAVAGDRFAPRREYFPFFSWSLFSDIPEQRSTFELYIHRVNQEAYDEPRNFYELREYFRAARRRNSTIAKSVKAVGRALARGEEQADHLRSVLEDQLLAEQASIDYEITRVVFRPLDRWQHGELIRREPIARFVAERSVLQASQ